MNPPISLSAEHITDLVLADGSIWNIIPSDDQACDVVLALAKDHAIKVLR